jgi:hypothetical protein
MTELSSPRRLEVVVIVIVLIIAIILQSWISVAQYVLPLKADIRTVDDLSALERSAYLGFGDDFAKFMSFLRNGVPENGTVVVPPMSADELFGNSALMQYFLYPRMIKRCDNTENFETCRERYSGTKIYMLSTSQYNPKSSLLDDASQIPFDETKGLIITEP